jgi:long-chain acyl-CoA synthetase
MKHSACIHEFLTASAAALPGKVALVCGDVRLTYADIDLASDRVATWLVAQAIGRGDRVVLHLGNSMEMVISIFGVLKTGATIVPIGSGVKAAKLAYIVKDCAAKGFFCEQIEIAQEICDTAEREEGRAMACCVVKESTVEPGYCSALSTILANDTHKAVKSEVREQDIAALIYTSGSTGVPKGVICPHESMAFAAESIIDYLGLSEHDIVINALPLSFDYGLYQLLMMFKVGGRLVLETGFAFPVKLFERIQAEHVTGLPGVPTMFELVRKLDLAAFDLSSLRFITNTAAALSPTHVDVLRERFPNVRLFSMYGLTETKRTLYLPHEDVVRKRGSVGIPIPGTEVWLEDDDGRRLPHGSTGELVARGRHVMAGYWGDSVATRKRFSVCSQTGLRCCHTGDIFRSDEDGYYYFLTRKDDIIKTRGEKVAPKEIENVIYEIPGVSEVAVIGVADHVLGHAVKAIVVAGRPLSKAEIVKHCRQKLEEFMVPKIVEFASSLPHSDNGKVAKALLK